MSFWILQQIALSRYNEEVLISGLASIGKQRNPQMPGLSRITSDPAIMNGQPCIRGMRLTVRRVLEALATYPDREEFRAEYPELEEEDVRQALAYAAASLDDKVLELRDA